MANKLELTWYGKEEPIIVEPRLLIENAALSNCANDPDTFIQRVEVGERAKRYDRNAPQEIRIYYRDIGLIDEMPETMTEETKKPTQTEVA